MGVSLQREKVGEGGSRRILRISSSMAWSNSTIEEKLSGVSGFIKGMNLSI